MSPADSERREHETETAATATNRRTTIHANTARYTHLPVRRRIVMLPPRLSVVYIGPKSRTGRPVGRLKLAQRYPTSHVTRTPLSIQKVKGQLAVGGAYCSGLPHSLLYAPLPRRFQSVMLSDVCRSVWRLSRKDLSREQRGLGGLKWAQVAHVTRDLDTTFKVRRSTVKVAGVKDRHTVPSSWCRTSNQIKSKTAYTKWPASGVQ